MSVDPRTMPGNPTKGKGNNPVAALGNIIDMVFSVFGIFPKNKTAAILLWLGSTYSTALLFDSVGANGLSGVGAFNGWITDVVSTPLIFAVIAQFILTVAESPFWMRNEKNIVTISAMSIDVAIVAAAVYPFTKNFGSSTIWQTVVDALSLSPEWNGFAGLALAIILGIIGAAGPEKIWNSK